MPPRCGVQDRAAAASNILELKRRKCVRGDAPREKGQSSSRGFDGKLSHLETRGGSGTHGGKQERET